MTTELLVDHYRLLLDRHYDQTTHMWVLAGSRDRARCGFDPLGSETSGDVVAISFEPVGTTVERGEPFGTLEAAKFVGPLPAPISGRITAHNDEVLERPGLVNVDPLGSWLVEIEPAGDGELTLLLNDRELVRAWFELEVERFRERGMIAE